MRIQDLSNMNTTHFKKNEIFKEGSFISGKILKLEGNIVTIKINGTGVIEATTTDELRNYIGKEMTFLIKSIQPNEIQLKPTLNNQISNENPVDLNKGNKYLAEILREFGIKDDETSVELLDNLIKYRVEINKENVYKGISILDKFQQFANLKDSEIPLYFDLDFNGNEHIPNEKSLIIKNADIQNLIITDKSEIPETSQVPKAMETTESTMENKDLVNINDLFSFNMKTDNNLIKTIAFFIKFNIKPTINNLNHFIELNEDPEVFSKDYEIFKDIIDKEFTNIQKNIMIGNGNPKDLIEETQKEYIKDLKQILNYINRNREQLANNKDTNVEDFVDKIKLIKELNNELVFVYLPLKLNEDLHNGVITLLKKRKNKNHYENGTNILITLNTNNLGKIKITCKVLNSNMDIKFENIKDEDINLFETNEDKLKDFIKTIGFDTVNIVYSKEESNNILDALMVNPNSVFYFDVKV